MSAESGVPTYRGRGGIWNEYKWEEYACENAFKENPDLVLDFHELRRIEALECKPHSGHFIIKDIQDKYPNTTVITQNIDDLHERAGSNNVLHLHGEITKGRSTISSSKLYDLVGTEINLGDLCDDGSQMRPHIVWFGEPVPMMEKAIDVVQESDYLSLIHI